MTQTQATEATQNPDVTAVETAAGSEPNAETKQAEAAEATAPTPEESQTEETTEAKEAAEPQEGPPESYEFTTPEGVPEDLSPEFVEVFSSKARELGLTQEKAQDLLGILPALYEQGQAANEALIESWKAESEKLLGEGPDRETAVHYIDKAVDRLGIDGLREFRDGPAGHHPVVNALLLKVGKDLISPDREFVTGDETAVKPDSEEARARALLSNSLRDD